MELASEVPIDWPLIVSGMSALIVVFITTSALLWVQAKRLRQTLNEAWSFDPFDPWRPKPKPPVDDKNVLEPRDDDLVVSYSILRG